MSELRTTRGSSPSVRGNRAQPGRPLPHPNEPIRYQFRKLKAEYLRRARVLAAVLSEQEHRRFTLESVFSLVVAEGLDVLEKRVYGQQK